MQNTDLVIWVVGGVGIVGLLLLNIFADWRRKRKRKDDEPVEAEYEEVAEAPTVNESPYIGDLRVSALQEMVRQSVLLNLAALDSHRQMTELAREHREDAVTERDTSFQSEIVDIRFRPPEDWPRGRF